MKYESLDIWKRSRALSIEIYRESKHIRDYGFKDQMTRSALSIPSNIAEGFEKDYEKEKARFLSIAKGSAGELKTQVDIGVEVGFIKKEVGINWMKEVEILSKMIGKLIVRLNNP